MDEKSDREELRRRLEQAKRIAALLPTDDVFNERLQKLVQELEEQLRRRSGHAPSARRTALSDEHPQRH
jgi:hypothetical protein